jgi:hypothetical protein
MPAAFFFHGLGLAAPREGRKEGRRERPDFRQGRKKEFGLVLPGRTRFASGCAFAPSLRLFRENAALFKKSIVLRPPDIGNHPEAIGRLGVI